MKKIGMILALVGVVMFAFTGSAMATMPGETTLPVSAQVAQYAEVALVANGDVTLDFLGNGLEGSQAFEVFLTLEANCDVTATVTLPYLQATITEGTTDELYPDYDVANAPATANFANPAFVDPNPVNGSVDISQGQTNGSITSTITGTVLLGDISDQHAGTYNGTVLVTVSADI